MEGINPSFLGLFQVFVLCVVEMHFLFFGKHLLVEILVLGPIHRMLFKYWCHLINSPCSVSSTTATHKKILDNV
jgi:hypothetical protein